jgi:hypothetical protein
MKGVIFNLKIHLFKKFKFLKMYNITRKMQLFLFLIIALFIIECLYFEYSNADPVFDYSVIKKYNGPKLPIGMNLPEFKCWQPGTVFTDVMKSASGFIYYDANERILYDSRNDSDSSEEILLKRRIGVDENGYPISIPQDLPGIGKISFYRFLVNNYYPAGKYNIFFDGEGSLGGCVKSNNGQYYINLTGNGENTWIDIISSSYRDHIRNIRILPEKYAKNSEYPVFFDAYLEGLKPFHCIRFMDWFGTNNSKQVQWVDRTTKNSYSQGRGIVAYEYAIEICNTLKADAWVCVPHMASDDYIKQMAILWRDNLKTELKIYLEYSNELWNWGFWQTHWVNNNGMYIDERTKKSSKSAVDKYILTDLKTIEATGGGYPEKDAYMMARVFRIWTNVFGVKAKSRLVRVATGQQAWVDNSRRILKFLFNTDKKQTGCDAFAVGGYIGLFKEQHDIFIKENKNLTYASMYETFIKKFEVNEEKWIYETAEYARKFGVDYLVYEGGQHFNSFQQSNNWSYLKLLYEFQINPHIYNLYSKNFFVHVSPKVNCKLFMAYDYVGPRENIYGSWGHLEKLAQVGTDYKITAPKYQALLDANKPKK